MVILRLAVALFLVQSGFHAYTASMPLALGRAGVADASIGLVMGVAAIVQIPAAILGGRLLDAFGGSRLFTVAGFAYLAATGILLLPGVEPGGSLVPYVAARVLQGIGIGLALPAALSLVPMLLPSARQASGLAYVGAAHNLTLVVMPPLSIALLNAGSLDGVGLLVIVVVLVALVLGTGLPARQVPTAAMAAATRAATYGARLPPGWTPGSSRIPVAAR